MEQTAIMLNVQVSMREAVRALFKGRRTTMRGRPYMPPLRSNSLQAPTMTKALAKYLTILLVENLEKGGFVCHNTIDSNEIQSWFEKGQFNKVEEFIYKIS